MPRRGKQGKPSLPRPRTRTHHRRTSEAHHRDQSPPSRKVRLAEGAGELQSRGQTVLSTCCGQSTGATIMQISDLSRGEPWRDRAASPGTPRRPRPLALSRRAREAGPGVAWGFPVTLARRDEDRRNDVTMNEKHNARRARISRLHLDSAWRDFQSPESSNDQALPVERWSKFIAGSRQRSRDMYHRHRWLLVTR